MSLVGTLGKMAVGMVVAKGVKGMMGGGQSSGGGLGGLLGSLTGGGQQSGGGGLGGLLGSLTGGGQQSSGGGLGGLLGSLTGGGQQSGGGGGIMDLINNMQGDPATGQGKGKGFSDLLSSLSNGGNGGNGGSSGGVSDLVANLGGAGGQASGGGLGGILDSLSGSGAAASGGLGSLLNGIMQGNQTPQPTAEHEKQAEIMLNAMISAAKSDGQIDEEEQQKIAEHLDDVTPDELAMVRRMMSEPNDMQALISSVPSGMEQQVYFMSLLGIDLDSKAEVQYLNELAQGLGISHQACNDIHQKLGAPVLYS